MKKLIEKLSEIKIAAVQERESKKSKIIVEEMDTKQASLLLGSAEGHEYPDLQVGDEVDPRLFLIPIKIYNIDPL